MENFPKHKKKLTRVEAGVRLVHETQLAIFQGFFVSLEKNDLAPANALRRDHDQFMSTAMEVMQTDSQGEYAILEEIRKKIPNNFWLKVVEGKIKEFEKKNKPSSGKKLEAIQNGFADDVRKKIEGSDIN